MMSTTIAGLHDEAMALGNLRDLRLACDRRSTSNTHIETRSGKTNRLIVYGASVDVLNDSFIVNLSRSPGKSDVKKMWLMADTAADGYC